MAKTFLRKYAFSCHSLYRHTLYSVATVVAWLHSSVCVLGQFTRKSFSVARVKAVYSQCM